MGNNLQHSYATSAWMIYTWTYSHQSDSCCLVLRPVGVKVEVQLMRHSEMEVAVKSLVVLWRSGSARTWSSHVLYSGKEVRENAAKPHSRGCLGLVDEVEATAHLDDCQPALHQELLH